LSFALKDEKSLDLVQNALAAMGEERPLRHNTLLAEY
jgi:hypothetical protein